MLSTSWQFASPLQFEQQPFTPQSATVTSKRPILADHTMKARFAELGCTPVLATSAEFGKFTAAEIEKWAKVIRAANIKPD